MNARDEDSKPSAPPAARPRKRRRTGKACASCRRRKTRCDGSLPCEACRIGELGCSYDEPDRRMTAVEYIQTLEKKVEELETLLGRDSSSRTLEDRSTPSTGSGQEDEQSSPRSAKTPPSPAAQRVPEPVVIRSGKASASGSDEDVIETMVGTGESDSPYSGSSERYRGSFAGLALLQRVHNLCRTVSAKRKHSDAGAVQDDFVHAFDFGSPDADSTIPWEAFALLPPKYSFDRAADIVVTQACCNMQFLDRQMLEALGNQVYSAAEREERQHSRKPFALLYAVLALGRRFEPAAPGDINTAQSTRGLRYFRMSRALLDLADSQDIISLQTLLCMVLYTQVSSMMSTAYQYICMAVAAALQMGLFTEAASSHLPEPERSHRRRIFSVLNIMDTYVTTALGLPRTLRDVNSDHVMPSVVKPESMSDPMAGTYAHAELISILASAVESNHPVTRPISQKNGFYGVEYSKITATEEQLEAWFENLPENQQDATTHDGAAQMRSQLLLRLSYAHVQMVLYRPFLHHALKTIRRDTHISLKAYACGSACIKAAMQVVWLVETLENCHLFNEAHWFTTLIMSFTAACLVLFVMSNESDPTLEETRDAVRRVQALCYRHSNQSASMNRCFMFLENLFPKAPSPEIKGQSPLNAWSREVSSTFNEAYLLPDDAGLEPQQDLVQALSLPQLTTFLTNRI